MSLRRDSQLHLYTIQKKIRPQENIVLSKVSQMPFIFSDKISLRCYALIFICPNIAIEKTSSFPIFSCPNIAHRILSYSTLHEEILLEFSQLGRRGENAWHGASKPERGNIWIHTRVHWRKVKRMYEGKDWAQSCQTWERKRGVNLVKLLLSVHIMIFSFTFFL